MTASFSVEAVSMSTLTSARASMISRHASIPSLPGISTSMMTEVRDHLLRHPLRLLAVAGVSHHLELAGPLQQLLETVTHHRVVIHQQDSDRC